MKTKINFLFISMLFLGIAVTTGVNAQLQANAGQSNQMIRQASSRQPAGNYSFRVFMASNKSYGYDILSNSRLIYHQPAFSRVPGDNDIVITKKEQANIAAMLAIDKIKNGKNPELSNEELKKITAY